MIQITNLLQLNKKGIFLFFLSLSLLVISSCKQNVVDSNKGIKDLKWSYRDPLKTEFEILDSTKSYNVFFKLRITDSYRYSNLFVLVHFKDGKVNNTKRYQFRLAKNDGEWLGSGSGNLFTYNLPLLRNHQFPRKGKYEIEIEQNMRENPLAEISDVGILIQERTAK